MPYYYRRWRRWRRPRRFWRRRARKAIWRRHWRRRHRRVRKKLQKITIRQWQPQTIKKLLIRGQYPLFQGTTQRTGNNMTQYIDSIAPHNVPGGGLFSITQMSLAALYELHTKARNWWTQSNCTLPLIRYLQCKIRLYRAENVDYIFVYTTCGDLKATQKLYQSCQPSVLMYNKHKIIVKCNKNSKHRKPYVTVRINPPPLFTNKWYFQQEIAKTPLLLWIASACSLDRYYTPSTAISPTIGFISLNTNFYKFHNFKHTGTNPYVPNERMILFTTDENTTIENIQYRHLILLGNAKDHQKGTSIIRSANTGDTNNDDSWHGHIEKYFSTPALWGNPFYETYFDEDYPNYYVTQQSLETIKTNAKKNKGQDKVGGILAEMAQPRYWNCRYNPQADSSRNAIFFSPITGPPIPWEEPHDTRLHTDGLPLWLMYNGLIDYHAKALDIQRLQTDYISCIISDYITPHEQITYYVPIDEQFLHGKSAYEPLNDNGLLLPYDKQNFHPKVNYQLQQINKIITTGPGSAKLPDRISCEAHLEYFFYFKLGGCPPPMDDVCDPAKQPKYPTPGNILSSTLLQNPETPIEYYISSFDQRREILTKRAAKRLKTDFTTKEHFFDSTGKTSTEVPLKTYETTSDETSDEEKDPETLQLKLRHQRRKQRKLQQRIYELLKVTQSLE